MPPPLQNEFEANSIDNDIRTVTKNGEFFLEDLQKSLQSKYSNFGDILTNLEYLHRAGVFKDLNAEEYSLFRNSLSDLFDNQLLNEGQRGILNQEKESMSVRGESLKDTEKRVLKWLRLEYLQWNEDENILIVAHGNSLRAMIKVLEEISDEDIINLSIGTGSPVLYSLDGLSVSNKLLAREEFMI